MCPIHNRTARETAAPESSALSLKFNRRLFNNLHVVNGDTCHCACVNGGMPYNKRRLHGESVKHNLPQSDPKSDLTQSNLKLISLQER